VRRCAGFFAKHPTDTSKQCAVTLTYPSSYLEDARGWQRRHRVEVDAALLRLWRKDHDLYGSCASQATVVLPDSASEGAKQGKVLWAAGHQMEVAKCAAQTKVAADALFEALFLPDDLPLVAFQILNSTGSISANPALLTSIKRWAIKYPEKLKSSGAALCLRSAKQFLYLYGRQQPQLVASGQLFVARPTGWSLSASNTHLVYSDDLLTVTRPGSSSCYPAALAFLPSTQSALTIILTSCTTSSNW
jgi:hypothetical protein